MSYLVVWYIFLVLIHRLALVRVTVKLFKDCQFSKTVKTLKHASSKLSIFDFGSIRVAIILCICIVSYIFPQMRIIAFKFQIKTKQNKTSRKQSECP